MIDAHIHLFESGFQGHPLVGAMNLDERSVYDRWRQEAGVSSALVVGWEDAPWASTNNSHIAFLAAQHAWIRPVAFVHDPSTLEVADLERWADLGFIGLSIYSLDERRQAALFRTDPKVWAWLIRRNWIVSVNSRSQGWKAWEKVLDANPDLTVLVSHLGLPRVATSGMTHAEIEDAMQEVVALARFPRVQVKLSGFYALTAPAWDYPHTAAWPYVHLLVHAFSAKRLMWGSDFSPCLQALSLPQTYALFELMPFISEADLPGILGENLQRTLAHAR